MANDRPRRRRPVSNQRLLAFAMWIVLGIGLVILGIMLGLAYIRETTSPNLDLTEDLANWRSTANPEPDPKPNPVVAAPDPEVQRLRRDMELPKRQATARKPEENPVATAKTKPEPEVAKKPPEPKTLKEAGGTTAGQQSMLDQSRTVADRAEEIVRKGGLTDAEHGKIAKFLEHGRHLLAQREVACEAGRWRDVMRYTREKIADTAEHNRYLDDVDDRLQETAREAMKQEKLEAVRKAKEQKKREAEDRKAATWTLDKIRHLGKLVHKLPQGTKDKVELYRLQSDAERISTKKTKGIEYFEMKIAAETFLAAYNRVVPESGRQTVRTLTR